MKNSIRNTLIALTAAVGISTTVHVLSESYRDKVIAVLTHDGKVALSEKETFLNTQPDNTDTKNMFLAIKSTNTIIEGIIKNHLGDNAIIDDSIQEELNNIYRDLV